MKVKIELTGEQIVAIMNVLAERPFREVAPLINEIGSQFEKAKTPQKGA